MAGHGARHGTRRAWRGALATAAVWYRMCASAAVNGKRDRLVSRKKERCVGRWPSSPQYELGLQMSRAGRFHAKVEGHRRVMFFPLLHV